MKTTLNVFKYLTSTCWNERYQHLTIDMTKNADDGRYRLGLKSIFIPDPLRFEKKPTSIFEHIYLNEYLF